MNLAVWTDLLNALTTLEGNKKMRGVIFASGLEKVSSSTLLEATFSLLTRSSDENSALELTLLLCVLL